MAFGRNYKVIAVDFDGTLFEEAYPSIGAPKYNIINAVKFEVARGSKIILWTCRSGQCLEEAIDACKGVGITFDAINDNLPSVVESMDGKVNCRKIAADEYWDDRAIHIS